MTRDLALLIASMVFLAIGTPGAGAGDVPPTDRQAQESVD